MLFILCILQISNFNFYNIKRLSYFYNYYFEEILICSITDPLKQITDYTYNDKEQITKVKKIINQQVIRIVNKTYYLKLLATTKNTTLRTMIS